MFILFDLLTDNTSADFKTNLYQLTNDGSTNEELKNLIQFSFNQLLQGDFLLNHLQLHKFFKT